MDLIDRLAQLSVQALKQQEIIETEEATKNALDKDALATDEQEKWLRVIAKLLRDEGLSA